MPIRLLLACRDGESAHAICAKLVQAAGNRIAARATDKGGVLSVAAAFQPDVVVLEHDSAEEKNSWQMLGRLRQISGGTRFLLLCQSYTHLAVIGFVRRGVDGCVLRQGDPSLLAKAVIAVHGGETWFGRTALLQALRSQIAPEPFADSEWPQDQPGQELLTEREREILGLIGNAMSNKEIARRLRISDKTVKTHLHHIYVKLNQSGRYKAFLSNVSIVTSEGGLSGPPQ
jgi:DNA-binding NarL/FixJ family response regulator